MTTEKTTANPGPFMRWGLSRPSAYRIGIGPGFRRVSYVDVFNTGEGGAAGCMLSAYPIAYAPDGCRVRLSYGPGLKPGHGLDIAPGKRWAKKTPGNAGARFVYGAGLLYRFDIIALHLIGHEGRGEIRVQTLGTAEPFGKRQQFGQILQ